MRASDRADVSLSTSGVCATHARLGVYGPTQRWIAVAESLRAEGWPVLGARSRWKLGELTVPWSAVAPA